MAYTPEIREKAFNIYRKCNAVYTVAKEIGVNPLTVINWRAKYNWDDKINKIKEKVMLLEAERAITDEEKTLEDQRRVLAQYAKDDEDNLKILKAFKAICIDEINKYKASQESAALEIKSLKDATEVMNNVIKLERLIKGDPTEYLHHTVSPIDTYHQERVRNDDILRQLREELDDIRSGRLIEHKD